MNGGPVAEIPEVKLSARKYMTKTICVNFTGAAYSSIDHWEARGCYRQNGGGPTLEVL